jgi:hypothetical protein
LLVALLYLWSTMPGRYQVMRLSDGVFLRVNTATGEQWIVVVHGAGRGPDQDQALDTSVLSYSGPLRMLRRLNIVDRSQ